MSHKQKKSTQNYSEPLLTSDSSDNPPPIATQSTSDRDLENYQTFSSNIPEQPMTTSNTSKTKKESSTFQPKRPIKHSNISMTAGAKGSNINMLNTLRENAVHSKKARVDNTQLLYRTIPKMNDILIDDEIRSLTLIYIVFALVLILLSLLAIIGGYDVSWKYGTFIGILSNSFSILHSMYSGSIKRKSYRLNECIQNFANIILKFSKALNVQEIYLENIKCEILDFIDDDLEILNEKYVGDRVQSLINERKAMANDDKEEKFDILLEFKKYHDFIQRLKEKIIVQHKQWLLTFFKQYQYLDNRFGITKNDYYLFVEKLPKKSKLLFKEMLGIHKRFKILNTSDEYNAPPTKNMIKKISQSIHRRITAHLVKRESYVHMEEGKLEEEEIKEDYIPDDSVLLYKDMEQMVKKVIQDIIPNEDECKYGNIENEDSLISLKYGLLTNRISMTLERHQPKGIHFMNARVGKYSSVMNRRRKSVNEYGSGERKWKQLKRLSFDNYGSGALAKVKQHEKKVYNKLWIDDDLMVNSEENVGSSIEMNGCGVQNTVDITIHK